MPSKHLGVGVIAPSILLLALLTGAFSSHSTTLSQAISTALKDDPARHANLLKQQAMQHQAEADSYLPDPSFALDLNNLAADSFDFKQEAMTQLRLTAKQSFARGQSLAIKKVQGLTSARQYSALNQIRQAKLIKLIAQAWLDTYLAKQQLQLLQQQQLLLQQLNESIISNYSSGVVSTNQQDVVLAQVELSKLKLHLSTQQQRMAQAMARLSQYLPKFQRLRDDDFVERPNITALTDKARAFVASQDVKASSSILVDSVDSPTYQYGANWSLDKWVSAHPELKFLELQSKLSKQQIELKKQAFEPKWSVTASYGLRQQTLQGEDRSDVFSLGVSVSLPLFSDHKQHQDLAAAAKQFDSSKLEQELKHRELTALLSAELAQYHTINQQLNLYQTELLLQLEQSSESALTAYTNDNGSIEQILNAKLGELNSKLTYQQLQVNKLKSLLALQYYLTPSATTN